MKIKIEDIKKGLDATKEYFFHPIAALFKSKKITNNKELTQYVRNESAKVTQQTLYEYVRNRMGTLYVKMHDDQKFIDSLNIATWNIYTIALQDLTLYSHSVIENIYKKEFSNLELENFYKTILDLEINKGLGKNLQEEKIKEFYLRLQRIDLKSFYQNKPFKESSLALYYWAPIADELKKQDRNIVLNSIHLKWKNIEKEFSKLLNF
jgi:glutamate synthase domain-containing protein 1